MIQDIFASIGGFTRIILTFAGLFDFLFHHFSIYKDLNFDISHNYQSLSNKIIKRSTLFSQKNVNCFENLFKRKNLKNNYVNSNHNNLNSSYNFKNSNGNFIVKKKINQTHNLPKSKSFKSEIILKKTFETLKSKHYIINKKKIMKSEDYFFSSYNNNNLYYNIFQTNESYKKIKILDFIINFIPCFYPCKKFKKIFFKNKINNLIDFRKNIISEEAMFSFFYIQTTFNKILLNREKKII